jgi:hypothetical protein
MNQWPIWTKQHIEGNETLKSWNGTVLRENPGKELFKNYAPAQPSSNSDPSQKEFW